MAWIASAWDYLWEAVRTHPFNFFTLALAGAALIYAHRSAQASRRQGDEAEKMRRISEEALGVAETSANAASESARTARETLELTQRPWVVVKGFRPGRERGAPPDSLPKYVLTTLVNTGTTPALSLTARQDLLVTAEPFPNMPEFVGLEALASRGPLGPDGHFQLRTVIALPAERVGQIMNGEEYLYVYGAAVYEDVFRKRHITKWCLIYSNDPHYHDFTYFCTNNTAD